MFCVISFGNQADVGVRDGARNLGSFPFCCSQGALQPDLTQRLYPSRQSKCQLSYSSAKYDDKCVLIQSLYDHFKLFTEQFYHSSIHTFIHCIYFKIDTRIGDVHISKSIKATQQGFNSNNFQNHEKHQITKILNKECNVHCNSCIIPELSSANISVSVSKVM